MAKKKKNSAPGNSASQGAEPTSKASDSPTAKPETKTGFDLVKFLKESKEELAKVVWPSRQQLIGESVTVILMVTLVATTIYLVDNLFVWLSTRVFS
ncbi:MAG: preprotein translocase subunit SecE [Spirulinaceae cyanobacterium]